MPAWPTTFPQICALSDMRMSVVSNSIAIDVEVGEPMTRRRFTGDMEDITGTLLALTRTEANALNTFYRTTLKDGSLTFTARHPMTLTYNTEFIFVSPPQFARTGHLFNVSIAIRKLP